MKSILVIDDEEQLVKMVCTMLEREGYRVSVAENGKQGMRLFRQEPVDLVITDIFMPEKEGLETIRELRREFPGIKIILITGMTDSKTRRQMEAADVDAYYYKPVEMTDFLAAIKKSGVSVTIGIVYAISRAANSVPELRLRIRGGDVIEHELVHPSFTVLAEDELFSFCMIDYCEDFGRFTELARERIAASKRSAAISADATIRPSCTPTALSTNYAITTRAPA